MQHRINQIQDKKLPKTTCNFTDATYAVTTGRATGTTTILNGHHPLGSTSTVSPDLTIATTTLPSGVVAQVPVVPTGILCQVFTTRFQ